MVKGWLAAVAVVLVATAVATVVATVPGRARASSCEFPIYPVVAPVSGAQGVATNTRIWVSHDDWDVEAELVLVGPDSVEVALTRQAVEFAPSGWVGTDLTVWTPGEALAPDTDYSVWACDGAECTTLVTEFRTGAGPATAAPAVPELLAADATRSCGTRAVELSASFSGILVVDFVDGTLDPEAFTGSGVHVSQAQQNTFAWPDVGDHTSLRIGAYGLDGSFSGWSEPISLTARGCTMGAAPRWPMLCVLLLGLRRRRRA
jgi:hypothetical protein